MGTTKLNPGSSVSEVHAKSEFGVAAQPNSVFIGKVESVTSKSNGISSKSDALCGNWEELDVEGGDTAVNHDMCDVNLKSGNVAIIEEITCSSAKVTQKYIESVGTLAKNVKPGCNDDGNSVDIDGSRKLDVLDESTAVVSKLNAVSSTVKSTEEDLESAVRPDLDLATCEQRKAENGEAPSTMPSGKDEPRTGPGASCGAEHKTSCVFEFSNSVIYDLDVE